MAEIFNSTTRQRHDAIFTIYCQYITELGKQATKVSKESMYEEVAQRTGYSRARVARIIAMKFRETKSTENDKGHK
jgi:hypothetical protein